MLAIDTNVLVRLVVDDDAKQAKAARILLENDEAFLLTTVLLETDWVLRSAYRLSRSEALEAVKAICGLPGAVLAEPERVAVAVAWSEAGMDFADALHLAGASGCEAFVTFDRKLAKVSAGEDRPPVRLI